MVLVSPPRGLSTTPVMRGIEEPMTMVAGWALRARMVGRERISTVPLPSMALRVAATCVPGKANRLAPEAPKRAGLGEIEAGDGNPAAVTPFAPNTLSSAIDWA